MNTYVTIEQIKSWRRIMRSNALVWRVQAQWENDTSAMLSLGLARLYRDLSLGKYWRDGERRAA